MYNLGWVKMLVGKNLTQAGVSSKRCNIIPSANSSLPLATNWENIPETLLLNGIIGAFLFILFLVMTQRAWKQSNSHEENENPSLINFLYGYRDPERWYVIPRYEFLRKSNKHHEHEMTKSNIYVPPKLPLSNPIELLVFDSESQHDEYRSVEEHHAKQPSIKTLLDIPERSPKKSEKINESNNTNASVTSTKESVSSVTSAKTLTPNVSIVHATSKTSPDTRLNQSGGPLLPLDQSFFYPSILLAEQIQASYLSKKLNQFFSLFFKVTDADIIYAKGIDAYEYLLFQRHLILIMFIINIYCLGLLLPVHWFANTSSENDRFSTSFQRTTIKNMPSGSIYYWAHILSSVSIVGVTMYIMRSYTESTIAKNDTQLSRRTLLMGNIPSEQRDRAKLSKIFIEHFPGCNVEAIQFVYDTWDLELLQMALDVTVVAKNYCIYQRQRYNREIMVKPTDVNENRYCGGLCRTCSFCLICCCYWPCETKQKGVEFYVEREKYLRDKITKSIEKLVTEPSEYAFVTFKTYKQAKQVMQVLNRLKLEVLSEKNTKMLSQTKTRTGQARKSLDSAETGTNIELIGSAERGNKSIDHASEGTGKSQFLVSGRRNLNDPLDPKNNPHIKSIRSPQAKRINSMIEKDAKVDNKNPTNTKEVSTGSSPPAVKAKAINKEGPIRWSVRYAPHPDNVEYYDLLNIVSVSKYTIGLLHFVMIIMFIFVTTPNVILSILERWFLLRPDQAKQKTGFQGVVINYLSTLLQVIATALLPYLITLISKQIPYEDTSSKNHSIMWKVYLFLVLMVIVMPSVGMSSAQAFILGDINPECLFPADNGAYFINYVVSSIFLSTILELIKPSDIVSYYFLLWTGRSKADFEAGRQYIEREFSVSMQHTSVLLIFSAVMTYTISCPLIAPAGLVYLIVKHKVDHYHLFYTYFTKKVDKNLQSTIEIFVRVAILLMLFQTTLSISINTGTSYFSLMSQIVFWVSLAVFIFNCFFDFTSRAIISRKRSRHHREFCACFYLPRVIEDLLRSKSIPESCISRKV